MNKGQGALEYLILIGGAVVVVLIVIFLLLNTSEEFRNIIEVTAGTDFDKNNEDDNGDGDDSIAGSLIGHWSFENGSLDDSSDLANHGIPEGGIDCENDPGVGGGNGCTFGEIGEYVDIGLVNEDDSSVEGTITAWVFPTVTETGNELYIIKGQQNNVTSIKWNASSSTDGVFKFCKGFSNEVPSEEVCVILLSVDNDNWHHVALTWENSNTMNIYLDGVFKQTKQFGWSDDLGGYLIGSSGTGQEFKGHIDEVMFFNRALSEEEIQSLLLPT